MNREPVKQSYEARYMPFFAPFTPKPPSNPAQDTF